MINSKFVIVFVLFFPENIFWGFLKHKFSKKTKTQLDKFLRHYHEKNHYAHFT